MTGMHVNDNKELLAAGAVLPADARDAGPSAVELTARAYRHAVFGEDRVVVRLAAAELGPAEDLAAGFLGLVPEGEPAVVGLGRRQELGFPEWVLVHHPEDGRAVRLGEVGPVAWSEGMRMAAALYAGRTIEEGGDA